MGDPCDYAVKMINRDGDLEDRPRPTIVKPCVDDRHDTELACFSTASIAPKDQVTYSGDDYKLIYKVLLQGVYL